MRQERIGFAMCGSFCTHDKALKAMETMCRKYETVIPILSETAVGTDTRFGTAASLLERIRLTTGHTPIATIQEAEPIGPKKLLDALVIAPCTGSTLARLALGLTDTAVAMAAKAHLRNDRPLILAVSTNDGLGTSAQNIGALLSRRQIFFVPFGQDDPVKKPRSLVADMDLVCDTVEAALTGRQLQPMLLRT